MYKPDMAVLEGDRVRLRPLCAADLPLTLHWRNQDEVRKWFFHAEALTLTQHQSWFDAYCAKADDMVFIIEEKVQLQAPVGQVALYHLDRARRRAEYGRLMIGDLRARGLGLAKDATSLLLAHAGHALRLSEVYLEVFAANRSALAVYQACGFVETHRHDDRVAMSWFAPELMTESS